MFEGISVQWNRNVSWPIRIENGYNSTCDTRSSDFQLYNSGLLDSTNTYIFTSWVAIAIFLFESVKLGVSYILTPSLPLEIAKTWKVRLQSYHENQAASLTLTRKQAHLVVRVLTDNWHPDRERRRRFQDVLGVFLDKLVQLSKDLGNRVASLHEHLRHLRIQPDVEKRSQTEKHISKWLVQDEKFGKGLTFDTFKQFHKDALGQWINSQGVVCTSKHVHEFMEALVPGTDDASLRTLWLTFQVIAGNYDGSWNGDLKSFCLDRYNPKDNLLPLHVSLKEIVPGTGDFDSTKTSSYVNAKLSAPARKNMGMEIYMPWGVKTQVFIFFAQLLFTCLQIIRAAIIGPPLFTRFYEWGFVFLTARLSCFLPLMLILLRLLIQAYFLRLFVGDPFRLCATKPRNLVTAFGSHSVSLGAGPLGDLAHVASRLLPIVLCLTCLPFTIGSIASMFSGPPLPTWCWVFWPIAAISAIVLIMPVASLFSTNSSLEAPLIDSSSQQRCFRAKLLLHLGLYLPIPFLPFVPMVGFCCIWFVISIFMVLKCEAHYRMVPSASRRWCCVLMVWAAGLALLSVIAQRIGSHTYLCTFSHLKVMEIDIRGDSVLSWILSITLPILMSAFVWLIPKLSAWLVRPVAIHKLWVFHSNDILSLALSETRIQQIRKASMDEDNEEPIDEKAEKIDQAVDAYTQAGTVWRNLESKKAYVHSSLPGHFAEPNSKFRRVRHLTGGDSNCQNRIGYLQVVNELASQNEIVFTDIYGYYLVSFEEKARVGGESQKFVNPVCIDMMQFWPCLLAAGDKVLVGPEQRPGAIETPLGYSPRQYKIKFDQPGKGEEEGIQVLVDDEGNFCTDNGSNLELLVNVRSKKDNQPKTKKLIKLETGDKIPTDFTKISDMSDRLKNFSPGVLGRESGSAYSSTFATPGRHSMPSRWL